MNMHIIMLLSTIPKINSLVTEPNYSCMISIIEPWHEISNNMVCATSRGSDQPAHNRSLIRAFDSLLDILCYVKLLAEHHLEFLSL